MSAVEGTSRLWPVLTALVVLPLGALVVEQLALHRGAAVRVIHVDAAHSTDGDDIDVGASAAVSPEHEAARTRQKQGDLQGAIVAYGPLTVAHPDSAPIAFEHGAALLANKQVDAAILELRRAAGLAPNEPRIAVLLARALVRSKDVAGAEAELRRALQIRPGYGSALRALGRLYGTAGRHREAIEVLTSASEFGSNEERATSLVALGAALLEDNRPEEGRAAFQKAIERAPAQVEIRLGAARAYLATDKKDDALRASGVLAVAADLAPDLPDVQTLLGQAREAAGDVDGAEDAYWQALRLAPQALMPRRRLMRLALDRQRFTKAKQHADELLAIDDSEPEHHFLAGLVASKQDDNAAARAHYERAIARADGNYPEAYFNLGLVEKDQKNLTAAIAAYEKAIAQRPGYHAAENNLGLALVAAGRVDDAEQLYRSILARSPTYAPAWINLGKLYSQQKKYPEAIDAYQKAIEVRPDSARALLDLGVAYARSGRVDDAAATYQKVIALNPRSASAWFNLGLIEQQRNAPAAAEKAWRTTLEIDADHVPGARRLAALLAARGDDAEARRLYDSVLDAAVNDVEARLGRAELLHRAGDLTGCARDVRVVSPLIAADAAEQRSRLQALEKSCL